MRKWQRFILMLFVLLFSSSIHVYAAPLPERTGAVTDSAGLFTASQIEKLEEALQATSYELIVLTARGLEEEAIQPFGNDIYNTWKLDSHQILLLITADPSSVHLVYDNEQIAEAVSRSELNNNQGIIDFNYKPLAAMGNPAEGIIAVSNYINALQVPFNVVSAAPASPTGATTAPDTMPSEPNTTPSIAGEIPIPTLPVAPELPTEPIGGEDIAAEQPSPSYLDNTPSENSLAYGEYITISTNTLLAIIGIMLLGFIALFLLRRSLLISRTRRVLEEAEALYVAAESKLNNGLKESMMNTDEVARQLHWDSLQLSEQLDNNLQQISFLSKPLNQLEVESLYNEVQVFAQRVELHQEASH